MKSIFLYISLLLFVISVNVSAEFKYSISYNGKSPIYVCGVSEFNSRVKDYTKNSFIIPGTNSAVINLIENEQMWTYQSSGKTLPVYQVDYWHYSTFLSVPKNGYKSTVQVIGQYVSECSPVTPPPPGPTPLSQCASITGKSFWGSQKGSTNPVGCISGCSTQASECAYVPPLRPETVVSCKMTVKGETCKSDAPDVMIGNPTPTPTPDCPNFYIGKGGTKVCMNTKPTPEPTPVVLKPGETPPPDTSKQTPKPYPTDANGKPQLNPDGSSGKDTMPGQLTGGTGGAGTGGTGGATAAPGETANPNPPTGSPSPDTSPGPSGSPAPTPGEGDSNVPDVAESKEFFDKKYEKTVSQVFETHTSQMAKSPVITAAKSYFTLSVSGNCPNWTIPSVMGMPSIAVDQFCSSTAYGIYQIMKIVLLIAASFFAFRIAILD